jgi:hypothetical protein
VGVVFLRLAHHKFYLYLYSHAAKLLLYAPPRDAEAEAKAFSFLRRYARFAAFSVLMHVLVP